MNRRTFLKSMGHSLALTCCVLAACTSTDEPVPTPSLLPKKPKAQTSNILRVAFPGVPKQLDPALYTVIEEHQLGFALFDGLVWIDAQLEPQPMLAERWEPTSDLRSWSFTLRQGVKFHHGTALTAEDVVYTFRRILDPKLNSPFRSSLSFVEKVVATDTYTVQFALRSPSAELPTLLGAPLARIVAHDYNDSLLAAKPSGTGPFQVAEYSAGVGAKVVRNPNYWQAEYPRLAGIDYRYLPYDQQVAALRNNEIDVISQLASEDAATLTNDSEAIVVEVPSGAYQNIVMRATEKPFADVRVRQALKLCVDRQTMLQRVLLEKGVIGKDHPVAKISPFVANLPAEPYDPDKARRLLAQAGYPNGLQLDLLTSIVRPGMVEMAETFQQMAKPAGIEIQVIRTPAQVYWSDYAGKVPFHTGNWGFRPSIDETFMVAYHSQSKGNESNWRNPVLDKLIDSARGAEDSTARKNLYGQAQKLLMEEGAVIIPYFKTVLMALQRTVQGFTPHPAGWLDFRETYLD